MVEAAVIALQRARAARAKCRTRDLEGPVHRTVLRYLRNTLPAAWIVLHAANKPRSAQQGAREKGLGVIAGWPDLSIFGPGPDGPSAWFMEIKAPGGKVSEDQRGTHDMLVDCGFPVRIVRSVEDARKAVSDWRLPSLNAEIREMRA